MNRINNTTPKRIIISRPDRIGDVILSTAIPREIKNNFSDSYVAVLVRSYTKDIYLNNPFVDKIILCDDFEKISLKGILTKAKMLAQYNFTHALSLLPNKKISYLFFLAGIENRIGVGHKLYQFLTLSNYVSRHKYFPLRHEADYSMDLARKIGVDPDDISPEIYLSAEEKNVVKQLRQEFLDDKKYLVGVHTTSGKSAPNWRALDYLELIKMLMQNRNIQVVVTDNKIPEAIKNIKGVLYPNVNKSLRESILNYDTLDLLVSCSTGPMHICAALKIDTVSLFCRLQACSPKLWKPLGNNAQIVQPTKLYCQNNCIDKPHDCTFTNGGIEVNEVYNKVIKAIGYSNNLVEQEIYSNENSEVGVLP